MGTNNSFKLSEKSHCGGTEHPLQKTFKTDYGIRKTLDECLQMAKMSVFQRAMELLARETGWSEKISRSESAQSGTMEFSV